MFFFPHITAPQQREFYWRSCAHLWCWVSVCSELNQFLYKYLSKLNYKINESKDFETVQNLSRLFSFLLISFFFCSYYGTTTTGILLTELHTLVVLSECVLRINLFTKQQTNKYLNLLTTTNLERWQSLFFGSRLLVLFFSHITAPQQREFYWRSCALLWCWVSVCSELIFS